MGCGAHCKDEHGEIRAGGLTDVRLVWNGEGVVRGEGGLIEG